MKNISLAIKKLSSEDLYEFTKLLNLKRSNERDIISSVLSISGLNSLLSGLSDEELDVFKIIYSKNEGMTFGEIEKNINISIPYIERITKTLSGKLLIYRIKNRQLLTNKLDKVYRIKEISDILNVTESKNIADHIQTIIKSLESGYTENKTAHKKEIQSIIEYDRAKELIEFIIQSGFIINLEDAKSIIAKKSFDKVISHLIENSIIKIFYSFDAKYTLFLSLNNEYAVPLVALFDSNTEPNLSIHNRYYIVLNLLNAFDTISTYGLFLTKQNIFRKIDKKRIADSMQKLYNISGDPLSSEKSSSLALSILSELKCLSLEKDMASISLKNIREDISQPQKLLALILLIIANDHKTDPYFPFPIERAKYGIISIIINQLLKVKEASRNYLKILTIAGLNVNFYDTSTALDKEDKPDSGEFDYALNLLCLLGLVEIKNGLISLSDIGYDLLPNLQGIKSDYTGDNEQNKDYQKCIYINPDFTLIIPVDDISSIALYHILTHTEIVKQDIIINAIISKDAIIKAHKRGLPLKNFFEKLHKYSKNEIPQNLNFLLKEWSSQTISIKVSHAILLKSNQAAFIEEVLSGKLKDGIIEQLSPNHAIININYIDDIIKLAKKNDAVISLFEK